MTHREPVEPLAWEDHAACLTVDPELFFPNPGDTDKADQAKTICGRCPVAAQCLDYALSNNETHGIFGGLGPRQRQQLRKRGAA